MKLLSDTFDDSIADFNIAYYIKLPQSFGAPGDFVIVADSSAGFSYLDGSKLTNTAYEGVDSLDANMLSLLKKVRYFGAFPVSVNYNEVTSAATRSLPNVYSEYRHC